MAEAEQQAGAETTEAVQKQTEGEGAQEDSLEAALAEFDAGNVELEKEKPTPDDLDAKIDAKVDAKMERFRMEQQIESDFKDAVKTVKGDLDLDEDLIEATIRIKAAKDPRITKAWLSRATNPEGYRKVLEGLGRNLAGQFQKTDQKLTDDREAMAAAVRGASPPTQPKGELEQDKIAKMSNIEFENLKRSMG